MEYSNNLTWYKIQKCWDIRILFFCFYYNKYLIIRIVYIGIEWSVLYKTKVDSSKIRTVVLYKKGVEPGWIRLIPGLFLSLVRDYFRDLENFLRHQYFSSVSLRIRKHVRLTAQIKKLSTDISVLNDECAKLEEQVQNDQQLITHTKEKHKKNVQVTHYELFILKWEFKIR